MAARQPMTLEAPAGEPHYVLSEPPPDITQPVQEVQAATAAGLGDEGQLVEGRYLLSDPPPDVEQPVQEAGPAARASALAGDQAPLAYKEANHHEDMSEAPEGEHDADEPAAAVLDNQAIYAIIREVAVPDSGSDLYGAVSVEQADRFGLAFGLVLFSQESGRLGSVLRLMQRRDAAAFAAIFGAGAGELLATTNASAAADRLKPVGGQPLWSPEWVARFRQAGAVPAFQAAQNEEAIEGQFRPMLNVALNLGFVTDRALAMVYDRVVTMGLGGGLRWVTATAGPLRTALQRDHALAMLGFDDLLSFQNVAGWTPQDGRFGPETHAALVGGLRRQGAATLPSADDLMCRLVRAAAGPARVRLTRLRDSTAFGDVAFGMI